ncbi:Cell wall protein TIR3 [Penicillium longicatenatum]|uniref:Cell wall protein TIR3 n=1 Tax=Penicillium longicatenatum TaxID=1561947 RepID=UPI0025491498|nr:Cell wall protein TIR3 [Penicillium longicatenatum]KAJ5650077.1 Cell wall protein TIR3 [Penicillium longicatenatum]
MKLTQTILALAIASVANAQLSSLPKCAQSCATNAIPASCGVDVACICDNKSFLGDIACCIAGKCTEAEQEETLKAAKGICSAGGVTDLPSTVACTTGASSTTASGTSTTSSDSASTTSTSGTTTASGSETTISGTAETTTTKSSSTTTSGTENTSTSGSATASSTSAAATNGGAVLGQNKDASFMAAAGAAAAFAILI